MRQSSNVGTLLTTNIRWTQLHAGTSRSILLDTSTQLPHVPSTWWMEVSKFLKHIGGKIILEEDTIPHQNVTEDIAIMDIILNLGISPQEIMTINAVRIFAKAYYLSDIIHPQENKIRSCFLYDRLDNASTSNLQWPKMPPPNDADWRLWRKIIHRAFTVSKTTTLRSPPSRRWKPISMRSRSRTTNVLCQHNTPRYVVSPHTTFKVTHINRRSLSLRETKFIPNQLLHSIPVITTSTNKIGRRWKVCVCG